MLNAEYLSSGLWMVGIPGVPSMIMPLSAFTMSPDLCVFCHHFIKVSHAPVLQHVLLSYPVCKSIPIIGNAARMGLLHNEYLLDLQGQPWVLRT